jgi:hypothetical protein
MLFEGIGGRSELVAVAGFTGGNTYLTASDFD